uniref:hypothetical protein n=1 Tax=Niallia taxi TaxID=2499688 RepID=UPI003F4972E0
MKSKMYQLFEEKRSVHVLYSYDGMKQYIDHVVDSCCRLYSTRHFGWGLRYSYRE